MQLHQARLHRLLTDDEQTIVALCTPRGSGALALIRLSGIDALIVADGIARLSSGVVIEEVASHTIHHGFVIDRSEPNPSVIDEVLFLVMHGPKTFTGQHTVEISCHNNPFVIDRIITVALQAGAHSARPGEFSKRAFLNNKIDLVQAEAINELINAPTEMAVKQSMATVRGSLSQHVHEIERLLCDLMSYVEASFEFLEEEQQDLALTTNIIERLVHVRTKIADLRLQFTSQKLVKEGVRIVLAGSVNAGKSTLFNTLLNQERAIVADHAGTTRDSIESGLYYKGYFWSLVDTAGLRETSDLIEQKSIERSLHEAASADVIVLVIDVTRTHTDCEVAYYRNLCALYANKIIVAMNKIDVIQNSLRTDLLTDFALERVFVSAQERKGIDALTTAIEKKVAVLFATVSSPFLLNQRQFNLLTEIERGLEFIANSDSATIDYEVVAYQLKHLLEKISELTGRNVAERVLDTIFDNFCVGK
ncbi:MAG: tRNA uridine-5-carboxymethylaminomethyl(34) synthesis GTPase MnmE [Candidatus Babeliales bacterium]|jgi:tRNA modification GTPase